LERRPLALQLFHAIGEALDLAFQFFDLAVIRPKGARPQEDHRRHCEENEPTNTTTVHAKTPPSRVECRTYLLTALRPRTSHMPTSIREYAPPARFTALGFARAIVDSSH